MEVVIVFAGLTALGYTLNNNGKTPRTVSTNNNIEDVLTPEHITTNDYVYTNMKNSQQNTNQIIDKPTPNRNHISTVNLENNRRLNLFIGKQTSKPKKEHKALFKQTSNRKPIHNIDDQIERSRFVASDKFNYSTPIEKKQVGPGVNVDPNIVSTGGFHPTTRILPVNNNVEHLHQLDGQVITGKSNVNLPTQKETVEQNSNFRFYTKSDESFLPTKADINKMSIRPDMTTSLSEYTGPKGNNEFYMGHATMYQENHTAGNYNQNPLRNTNRGCAYGDVMESNVVGDIKPTVLNKPDMYVTNREETYTQPVGGPTGHTANMEYNIENTQTQTQRSIIEQRNIKDFASNVQGETKGLPDNHTDSINLPGTNRENPATVGQATAIIPESGQNIQMDNIQISTTNREAEQTNYIGIANGGINYQPGAQRSDNIPYSLRSITENNVHMAGPQRINTVDKSQQEYAGEYDLKPETNAARSGNGGISNPTYGQIGETDTYTTRGTVNENFDPSLNNIIQNQLQNNPYTNESTNDNVMDSLEKMQRERDTPCEPPSY